MMIDFRKHYFESTIAILILFSLTSCQASLMSPSDRQWLEESARPIVSAQPSGSFNDLMPLKQIIGDARIVALGEATHGTHEFFQMKQRLLEFLVTQMGFNTLAIEANWPEANRLNDYIHSGKGDPAQLLASFHLWTINTQEMLDTITWMEAYNQDPSHPRKLSFAGFDNQVVGMAMDDVIQYLQEADPEAGHRFGHSYDCLRAYDVGQNKDGPQEYAALNQDMRSTCRGDLQTVLDWLHQKQADYEAHSSPERYAEALQSAGFVLRAEAIYVQPAHRDQYMAENLARILNEAGPDAKIVVSAHNGHIGMGNGQTPVTMGDFLRRQYGDKMVTVGFLFYQGVFNAIRLDTSGQSGVMTEFRTAATPSGNIESYFFSVGIPRFFLDLRGIQPGTPGADWLLQPHPFRSIGAVYDDAHPEYFFQTAILPRVFDLIVYFQDTSPSLLLNRKAVPAKPPATAVPYQP